MKSLARLFHGTKGNQSQLALSTITVPEDNSPLRWAETVREFEVPGRWAGKAPIGAQHHGPRAIAEGTTDKTAGRPGHKSTALQATFEAVIADIHYRTETKSATLEEAMKQSERPVRRLGGSIK